MTSNLITESDLIRLGFTYLNLSKIWCYHSIHIKIVNGTPLLKFKLCSNSIPATVEFVENLMMYFYGDYKRLVKVAKAIKPKVKIENIYDAYLIIKEQSRMPQLGKEIQLVVEAVWPELIYLDPLEREWQNDDEC